MNTCEIRSQQRSEMIDVTEQVREAVAKSGVKHGLCVVYCPHTTAAVTINENADPDVVHDVLSWLGRNIPKEQADFRHGEGNSDSHLKSVLVGQSTTLIVDGGDLALGRWQGVFFCEFDGPRRRSLHVQVLGK